MAPERAAPDSTVQVSPADRRVIEALLAAHLPGQEVRAFGSRATGRGLKRWSDLDLALMGAQSIAAATLAALASAFDESDLPFRVDLLAWVDAPPALRQAILADGVVVAAGAVKPVGTAPAAQSGRLE